MIRYLETEEKGRCLDLWREAFPEDSTEFCDYYFKEKMKDNRYLSGRRTVRLYPCSTGTRTGSICGEVRPCATISSAFPHWFAGRHKGYMRSLMLAMLRDMQEERMPFTFLMPARESLYRPYDFRYIYDQPRWVLKYNPHIHREPCNLKTLGADLAEWQTAWLKRQYEVFAIRDEAYFTADGEGACQRKWNLHTAL